MHKPGDAGVDVDDEAPGANATGGTITCTNSCVTLRGRGNHGFAWARQLHEPRAEPAVCAAGALILPSPARRFTSQAHAAVDV
ncbi:MAG: hypothetical protein IPL52_10875 [Flavobacteriales bacterium]|nr:hypothetical protein [Flavobacteriales bacterium]